MPGPADFSVILQTLRSRDVDFIVVGGVSAVLNGAPISTLDLGIVHDRTPANIERLQSVLTELNAYCRERSGRLIALKEAVGREKDRAVLPVLRRTLEERGGS